MSQKGEKEKINAGLTTISQKLNDLEISLFNVKQNVQIDEVLLEIHPEIAEAAKKVKTSFFYMRFVLIHAHNYPCVHAHKVTFSHNF